jgi:hypothetical protein
VDVEVDVLQALGLTVEEVQALISMVLRLPFMAMTFSGSVGIHGLIALFN